MEPFFIRCETCHARLRVRDERLIGQVQSCPKCGSMVQVLAPAGWSAGHDASPQSSEVIGVTATESSAVTVRLFGAIRQHAMLWSGGGAALVVAGGMVGALAWRGEDEVAARPESSPMPANVAERRSEDDKRDATPPMARVAEEIVSREVVTGTIIDDPSPTVTSLEPPVLPPQGESAAAASMPVATPLPAAANDSVVTHEKTRTLRLEPLPNDPTAIDFESNDTSSIVATPEYPASVDADTGEPEAKTQAAPHAVRVTNVADQLAVPIEAIELPAVPLGEFVALISEMAAVPISLDPAALAAVGVSPRTKVTVRARDVTIGTLLTAVLKEHDLAWEDRDGRLVVVQMKSN